MVKKKKKRVFLIKTETHKRSNPAGIKLKIEKPFLAVYKAPYSHVRFTKKPWWV